MHARLIEVANEGGITGPQAAWIDMYEDILNRWLADETLSVDLAAEAEARHRLEHPEEYEGG